MYFSRKCKITFISHGATIYSENSRFSDIENYPPLSELGHYEVDRICEFLKRRGAKSDIIYCSESPRTIQTAKQISKLYKKEIVVVDSLKPRKCGKLNGLTLEQVEKKNPQMLEKWFNLPNYDEEIDAESISDFIKRVKLTIDEIVEKNIGNRVIIVTYPDVIQAAICGALDIPSDKIATIYIRTGSATQISYYENWSSLVYSGYIPIN